MRRYAWVGQARLTAIFRLDTQRDGHALAQRVIANHVQWHLSFPPLKPRQLASVLALLLIVRDRKRFEDLSVLGAVVQVQVARFQLAQVCGRFTAERTGGILRHAQDLECA